VVGNKLTTFNVIGVVVPADFGGQFGVAFFGCVVRHTGSFNVKAQ
jgi:hypothetical protein